MPESQSLTVCRLLADDWQAYRAIRLAMLDESPSAFGGTHAQAVADEEQLWRQRLADNAVILARVVTRPAGSVMYSEYGTPDPADGALYGMWVDPGFRRAGVGRALVDAVIAQARAGYKRRVVLHVVAGNDGAGRLYERAGFVPTGHTVAYPHDDRVIEIEMVLVLDSLSGSPASRVSSRSPARQGGALPCEGVCMSEINVRALGEDDWQVYRDIRLSALQEAPEAFVATRAQEEALDEQVWRDRVGRSRRLVAESDGVPLGVVSVGQAEEPDAGTGELFGLWVAPEARGTGLAWKLVEAGADQARKDGRSRLSYWVGTDNGRAVAFASSFGFRPGTIRRPMRGTSEADGAEEMAMVLPLGVDPGSVPSPSFR